MSSPNGSDNHDKGKIAKLPLLRSEKAVFDLRHKAIFLDIGVSEFHIQHALSKAHQNETDVETELIANKILREEDYFRYVAKRLDVAYITDIPTFSILSSPSIDILLSRKGPLRIQCGDRLQTVISPSVSELLKLEDRFASKPNLKEGFAIASSSAIRKAVWQLNEDERAAAVVRQLHDNSPENSAKVLLTNWQSFILGILSLATFLLIFFQPGMIFLALHASLSLIYLASNLLKLSAGLYSYAEADQERLPSRTDTLPHYTVLVALYKEEQVAEQLIKAMSRLQWPKSKLDIKLICEADDVPTIDALIQAHPDPQFEIVLVPHLEPRTKPKALQYAMIGARGEYVVVYDAEDRPHPEQLFEAYRGFNQRDNDLACMQAPLVITNADAGWVPGLFSLEYAGLFRRLIPLLAHFGLPIPLGGTSNHFRKSALLAVGGWDPCNVTEDADLGIRLYSHGYNTGVLKRPTLETAPVDISIWIKQRTRWLKGWMQTWLVLMRHPLRLLAKRGVMGFIIIQVMITGLLIAALTYPLAFIFIANTLYKCLLGSHLYTNTLEGVLVYLDIINLAGIYIIFIYVGMSSLVAGQKRKIKRKWLFFVPFYWLLISIAGWRALSQLPLNSKLWEKTPHQPARRE